MASKDIEILKKFRSCLRIRNKIGNNISGSGKLSFRVQLGDINFYNFLLDIGLFPGKSKILEKMIIPEEYIFDFLRGHFDGDGTFYSYWDRRWHSSFMFYVVFISASEKHILWIREMIFERMGIRGHITKTGETPMYGLKYAKTESLKLLPKLYYNADVVCLSRKRVKIETALAVEGKSLAALRAGGETVYTYA